MQIFGLIFTFFSVAAGLLASTSNETLSTPNDGIDGIDVSSVALPAVSTVSAPVSRVEGTVQENTDDQGKTAASALNAVAEPRAGPSGVLRAAEQIQHELAGLGIPDGVDPSFLAALPDNIR